MRVRTGENPSQITSDHPDGARPTPRADSSEPLGRTSRPSPPDPAAPGAPAAPAAPEVPAGVPGLTALPDDTEATKYLQNNGIDDSKLKAELMNLTESAFEEQGTLVPADRADETVNPYYTIDGYDTVKPRQLHQMNAGFVKRLLEDPWGVETGDRGLTLWWLLPLSAAVLVLLLTVRRRARA